MRFKSLFAVALAVGGFSSSAMAGGADLALVPAAGTMMLHVDMERFRSSAFYKDVLAGFVQQPGVQKGIANAKAELGFDPLNDLSGLTLMAPAPTGKGKPVFLMAIKGKFQAAKLQEIAKTKGSATAKTHGGVSYLAGKNDMSMATYKGATMLGSEALIKGMIDGKGMSSGLQGLVKQTKQSADIWFAGTLPKDVRAKMSKGNPMLKDVSALRGSIDFAKGLALNISVAASAASAKKMAEMLKMGLAQSGKDPMMTQMGLSAMVQKMQITAKGNDLNIVLSLTPAEVIKLKTLMNMAAMMSGMGKK